MSSISQQSSLSLSLVMIEMIEREAEEGEEKDSRENFEADEKIRIQETLDGRVERNEVITLSYEELCVKNTNQEEICNDKLPHGGKMERSLDGRTGEVEEKDSSQQNNLGHKFLRGKLSKGIVNKILKYEQKAECPLCNISKLDSRQCHCQFKLQAFPVTNYFRIGYKVNLVIVHIGMVLRATRQGREEIPTSNTLVGTGFVT